MSPVPSLAVSSSGSKGSDDARPRVTGHFAEPDAEAPPLLLAIGRAVLAVAGLEKSMQLELSRLKLVAQAARASPGESFNRDELDAMDTMTAGRLLSELRGMGLPVELDERIGRVVQRRNDLVHHPYEDAGLVRALDRGDRDLEAIVDRLDRLALDAAELAVELQLFALPKLEKILGLPFAAILELIAKVDPASLENPRDRQQVEAIQALSDLDQLDDLLAAIGLDSMQPAPKQSSD